MTTATRIEHCNTLLRVLATTGPRLFGDIQGRMAARMGIEPSGRVYMVEEYAGLVIYVTTDRHWPGFAHDDRARRLVESMADYIRTGEPLPRWQIGNDWQDWGYTSEHVESVRAQAFRLPMFSGETSDFMAFDALNA